MLFRSVKAAKAAGVALKQTFAAEGKELRRKAGGYAHAKQFKRLALRRFVWNPTVRIAGRRGARWACGQAAFEPVHMSTGQQPGERF